MNGGFGNDTYVVDNVLDIAAEVAGGVDLVQSSVSYTLSANLENLTLTGAAAINGTGNAKNNIIIGNGASNVLNGGTGNDTINGGAGNDTINGGDGNDFLRGNAGVDVLNGGNGDDNILSDGDGGVYNGDAGNDTMFSGLGNETMNGGTGIDLIDHTVFNGNYVFNMQTGLTNFAGESYLNFENVNMGGGNDTVIGNASANVINGGAGNDTINGGDGNDFLRGNAGVDVLNGGNGDDNILSDGDGGIYNGDAGNDTMFSGLGNETMNGGTGIDLIDHTVFNGNYVFNMQTGLTNFAGESYLNFENVNMGGGNDTVTGNASANVINGGAGNDTINGGAGNDTINGGDGNDILNGGAGLDQFNFTSALTSLPDLIIGFDAANDTFGLNAQVGEVFGVGLAFTGGVGSILNAGWYFEGAGFTGNGGSNLSGIYVDTTTGNLWYNPTSGIAADSKLFATINPATVVGGVASLSNADFVLI
jgi:Ca2+-binding RTX toxin-like protein